MNEHERRLAETLGGQDQFTSFLERISDAFVAFDAEWRFVYVNEKAARIFGRESADLIDRQIWAEFPEMVGQPFHSACFRSIETQQPVNVTEHFPLDDRWFEIRIYPAEHGSTLLFEDVTERKQTEKALRSEQYLRRVLDSVDIIIGVMMPDGILVECNRAGLEISGLQPQDVLEKPFAEAYCWSFSAQSQARLRAAIQRAAHGEPVRYDVEARVRDGQFITMDFGIYPVVDEAGEVTCLLTWGIDVSERVRAQASLRNAQARLALTIRAANVGLFDWDLRTNAVDFSPEWKSQLGYEEHEISEAYAEWESRLQPDDRARAKATPANFIADPYPHHQDIFRMRHKDGSYRWILAQGSLLMDERGKPVRMLGLHLTDRIAAPM